MKRDIFIPEIFKGRPYAIQHFGQIVRWAINNHPFYQERYKNPEKEIPLLTRTMILENNDALLNGHMETGRTSGSTGIPVRFSWSRKRQQIQKMDNELYATKWLGGLVPRTRIIRSRGEIGPETLDISATIHEQIEFIQQRYRTNGAISVITYPTNAAELCQSIIDNNIEMSFIKRFSCYAEVFEPWHEALIRQAFPNAQVWTTYSAAELGMIAARCPHEPDFHHIFAHKLGVEVLNNDGLPCKDGELGKVVITDYFNRNSPFIRYDIEDIAAPAKCPCGKIPYPSLQNIAGKVRGLLKKPNGEKTMFSHLDASLRDVPGLKQFQVVQEELTLFTLRYVADDALPTDVLKDVILPLFYKHVAEGIEVQLQKEPIIERGENGKFYASICKV